MPKSSWIPVKDMLVVATPKGASDRFASPLHCMRNVCVRGWWGWLWRSLKHKLLCFCGVKSECMQSFELPHFEHYFCGRTGCSLSSPAATEALLESGVIAGVRSFWGFPTCEQWSMSWLEHLGRRLWPREFVQQTVNEALLDPVLYWLCVNVSIGSL